MTSTVELYHTTGTSDIIVSVIVQSDAVYTVGDGVMTGVGVTILVLVVSLPLARTRTALERMAVIIVDFILLVELFMSGR